MSIGLRLARHTVVGAGLRAPAPRLISTLSAAQRPRLPPPSSATVASLSQRRNKSNSTPSASAAPQLPPPDAELVSAAGSDTVMTTLEGIKTALTLPMNLVSEALINIPTPSYLVSIFALAFLARSAVTVPVQLWQRRRLRRLITVVNPEFRRQKSVIALETFREAKMQDLSHADYIAAVQKRVGVRGSAPG